MERQERTQTNVERTSKDGWAFGTAVILAPRREGAYPEGWLFVAEKTAGGWKVGLEGSETFSNLAEKAPTSVVEKGEKDLFAASSDREFQGVRTRLRLPWKKGARWKFNGGPHGWATGYDRPYSALELAGRRGKDQRVRAAAVGRVYRMCSSNRGWLRVVHPNGYATDYYHIRKNIKKKQGAHVRRGAFLGYTGEDVSCGGAAYGRHVHFALRRGGRYVALDNKTIGGWTFQQGKSYYGRATRGKAVRRPGTLLRNYGP